MPQDNPTEDEGDEISVPKLRGDNDLAMPEVQKIRKTLQMPEMRISGTLGDIWDTFSVSKRGRAFFYFFYPSDVSKEP